MITTIDVSHTHLFSFLSLSPPGQGLLSQSALQLNNQDAYAAAGYHSNQGLALGESVMGRSGQAGGAVHIYNQVQYSALCFFFLYPFYLLPLPLLILVFLHPSASLPFISLFTLSHTFVYVPFSVHSPVSRPPFPHLLSFQCILLFPSFAS